MRLALALGVPLHDVVRLPLEQLRRWRHFDRTHGLPDIAAQWQRALGVLMQTSGHRQPSDYMPLIAWSRPRGTEALLERLHNGEL